MSLFKNIFKSSEADAPISKVGWRQLTDLSELNIIVNESKVKPVLIFKHSTRCSVSRMVLKQFENEFALQDKIFPYFLDLLAYRAISDEIANRFGVVHQSPQMIVIKEGVAVYIASHESIAATDLNDYI